MSIQCDLFFSMSATEIDMKVILLVAFARPCGYAANFLCAHLLFVQLFC